MAPSGRREKIISPGQPNIDEQDARRRSQTIFRRMHSIDEHAKKIPDSIHGTPKKSLRDGRGPGLLPALVGPALSLSLGTPHGRCCRGV